MGNFKTFAESLEERDAEQCATNAIQPVSRVGMIDQPNELTAPGISVPQKVQVSGLGEVADNMVLEARITSGGR